MEDIDGFEPPEEGDVEPKKPFLLKAFVVEPQLRDRELEVAEAFRSIADEIVELPEGTIRTMLLERLADCRGSTLRAMKDLKK